MTLEAIQEMKQAHRVLADFSYRVPDGSARLRRPDPLRQRRHRLYRVPPRHRGDEAHLRRRQGVRAVAVVARGDAGDAVERSRERDRDRVRPHRRHDALSRHRQVAGGRHLAADPHRRGQQRGRLLRPAAEVRRLGRAGNPGQGGRGRDRLHRRRHRPRDHRGGAAGGDQHLAAVRPAHGDVCQRRGRSAQRVGGVGRRRAASTPASAA